MGIIKEDLGLISGGGANTVTMQVAPNCANGRLYVNGLILDTSKYSHFKSSGTYNQYAMVGYLDSIPTYGNAMSPTDAVTLAQSDNSDREFDISTSHPYLVVYAGVANANLPYYDVELTIR